MIEIRTSLAAVLLAVTASSIASPAAASRSTCEAVYLNSTRDVTLSIRKRVEMRAVFNQHCESNGSVRQRSGGINLAFPIEQIPVEFGLSGMTSDQAASAFCKVGAERSGFVDEATAFADTVVIPALQLYNQCKEIEERGLRISHTSPGLGFLNISGEILDTTSRPVLNALLYDPKKVACTSTSFGQPGRNAVRIAADRERPITRNFDIQCVRKGVQRGADVVYPPAEVTVATNMGDYSATFTEDQAYGPGSANQARTEALALQSRHATAITRVEIQLAAEKDKSRELQRRIDNPTLRSMLLTIGEYGGGLGSGQTNARDRIYCYESPHAYAERWCGSERPIVQHIGSHGGHKCGYSYYVISCLSQ